MNARVDASDASGRERRTVCPCLLTDVFISTDTIGSVRSGYPVEGAAALGFRAGILLSSSGVK